LPWSHPQKTVLQPKIILQNSRLSAENDQKIKIFGLKNGKKSKKTEADEAA